MTTIFYLLWSISHWILSLYLVVWHFEYRQQSGSYRSDGDSIGIPIFGLWAMQILLTPLFIWICMYVIRVINGKFPGKHCSEILIVTSVFMSINAYYVIIGSVSDYNMLSAYQGLWTIWLLAGTSVIIWGKSKYKVQPNQSLKGS